MGISPSAQSRVAEQSRIFTLRVKPIASLNPRDVLHRERGVPQGALQWVSLSNANLKGEEFLPRLLVINTSKRTIKLSWLLHHPQKASLYGSYIKGKEPIIRTGIIYIKNKQTKLQ